MAGRWAPGGALAAAAAAGLLLATLSVAAVAGAAETPAGHGHSMRLMLRLVDCLLDACDLQLELAAKQREDAHFTDRTRERLGANDDDDDDHGDRDDYDHNRSARPWQEAPRREHAADLAAALEQNELADDNTPLIDYLHSTWPMEGDDDSQLGEPHDEASCWREAAEWLRKQLLAIRMRLLTSSDADDTRRPGPRAACCVAETLLAFGQLERHLEDVCPSWLFSGRRNKMDGAHPRHRVISHDETGIRLNFEPPPPEADEGEGARTVALSYVIETIEIVAEVAREALGRPWPSAASGPEDELAACSVIERHRALLARLANAYELLASAMQSAPAAKASEPPASAKAATGSLMSEMFASISERSARLRRQIDLYLAH
jgi:hypothetical protein